MKSPDFMAVEQSDFFVHIFRAICTHFPCNLCTNFFGTLHKTLFTYDCALQSIDNSLRESKQMNGEKEVSLEIS